MNSVVVIFTEYLRISNVNKTVRRYAMNKREYQKYHFLNFGAERIISLKRLPINEK